jgi:hypothetical protein
MSDMTLRQSITVFAHQVKLSGWAMVNGPMASYAGIEQIEDRRRPAGSPPRHMS